MLKIIFFTIDPICCFFMVRFFDLFSNNSYFNKETMMVINLFL